METRSRTRSMLRGAAVLAALGALAAPATAGAAVKAPVIKSVTPNHANVGDKLIIRGRYFRLGKGRNRVLFQRTGGKSLFVKADVSTKVRMTVVVPKALELYMPSSAGALVPSRFRLRVLTTKLSKKFTSLKASPVIGPKPAKATTGPGTSAPVAPDGDCDGDGVKNSVDADDDNDLLPDQLEQAIGTDQCNSDSDGDGVEDGYEYRSAIDLNNDYYRNAGSVMPYPGKRPYPNPLYKDATVDYDGDGLTLATEYSLWKYTYTVNHTAARTLNPLSYSDGTRYSLAPVDTTTGRRTNFTTVAEYTPPTTFVTWAQNAGFGGEALYDANGDGNVADTPAEASAAGQVWVEKYAWDLDGNGYVSDDERDEDGDGLTNYDETGGRMTPDYWKGCYSNEAPYPIPYAGTSPVDFDSDGDGVLDGADDQDHDDVPNLLELSRQMASGRAPQWGGATLCRAATSPAPQPSALAPQGRVNPFNPCIPNAASRSCEQHPDMTGTAFPPYDDNGDKYLVLN
jgi:hypothetical protein